MCVKINDVYTRYHTSHLAVKYKSKEQGLRNNGDHLQTAKEHSTEI